MSSITSVSSCVSANSRVSSNGFRRPSNLVNPQTVSRWGIDTVNNQREDMSEAMRSMVASYQKQLHSESSFLDEIQQKAEVDTDFANEQRADDWSVKEVCYWLSQIHLDKYIKSSLSETLGQ